MKNKEKMAKHYDKVLSCNNTNADIKIAIP